MDQPPQHVTTIITTNPKASNDSDETPINNGAGSLENSAQIESADLASASGKSQAIDQQRLSGHHDRQQRRIYLILFGFSIASALVGFIMILTWMFAYRPTSGIGISDAGLLSNLHVVLMYLFMVSLNMYAVLVYRTHYNLAKGQLKWTHAILSGGNMVMSLLGVMAMLKAHLMKDMANFYSLHSWIGLATNAFFVMQFVAGFVSFLRPGLSQRTRAALMPWHRMAGTSLLVMAAAAALTGITEMVLFQDKAGYASFSGLTFVVNIAGISVILTTAITVYLLTAPQYLRPPLAEEMPLKR